ncbi:hypothetical protein IWW55_001105 [Coemansia sp. RSA 2706]|nr:hypothetical protein IWW55_001105 [Coemansia sp. RSA 2706]KAJ2315322.1 hypothetical protein IWW54_000367 [Coemansia sp. RSA 2705]KAJ2739676.1 hypothetical protein H4R23_000289 [Coemansia sp. Cherry 401B]
MDPRLLRYMRVSGPKLAHFWYAFTRNNDGVVSFDNLRTLQVGYDDSDDNAYFDSSYMPKEHISDSSLPVLAFPKLEKLVLFFCPEDKLRDWLTCPSLKSITYNGSLHDTTWLCKLQSSSLDMLQLKFICFETLDEEAVFSMKTLFSKFRGTRTISCKMCLSYSADMAKIDWPHLTHLDMRYIGNIVMLIDVLPMIPDLVCLTVEMNFNPSVQP